MYRVLLVAVLLGQPSVHYWDSQPNFVGDPKYFFLTGSIASSARGPTTPAFDTCGSAFGFSFDSPAVEVHYAGGAIPCWDGTNDILMRIFLTNELGDPIGDGETIVFKYTYRTMGPTAGTGLAGDAVVKVITYTQSGASGDCQPAFVDAILDKDDGDQSYSYGDSIVGTLAVNGTSTYSGDPIVGNVAFLIPYKQLCHIA